MLFKFSAFSRQFLVPKTLQNKLSKCSLCSAVTEERLKKINYYLIVDFEATCDKTRKFDQEIIEFPCLKINKTTLAEEGRFHRFVKPTINPILTRFCVELTGILQEMVENERTFPDVYQAFEEWREKENLTDENSLYITSGDWDFGHIIPVQCKYCDIKIPSHMLIWADIKKLFADNTGHYKNTLKEVMNYYNLKFIGRPHSGLDDCINIGNVVRCLVNSKATVYPTSRLYFTDERRKVERLKTTQKSDPIKHLWNLRENFPK